MSFGEFLIQNAATIAVAAVLALLIGAVIVYLVKQKKTGCSSGCAGCPYGNKCPSHREGISGCCTGKTCDAPNEKQKEEQQTVKAEYQTEKE